MSLGIETEDGIPAETIRIARASFGQKNGLVKLRDEFGPLFSQADFADLYSWKGSAGVSPVILATVTVLQYAEQLSDRQAAGMANSRIDWKYVLGVALDYAGFDASVLSEFRTRLVENEASERLLEKPLRRMRAQGLVKARGQQRTDSTHVLAAIRTLNRLELVGETLRQALNQIAIEGRGWLTSWVPHEWFGRYSSRIEEAKFPQDASKRQALVQTIAEDGLGLLTALFDPTTPTYLKQLPAVHVLWRVWLEQYEVVDGTLGWRAAGNLPPAERLINSPYDPEAHFSRKRNTTWTGYKVHLSESCDEALPHLITHVETTPATEPDCQTLPKIHTALAEKQLLPAEHLIDAGYVDIHNVVESHQQHAIAVIGPMRPDSSRQARQQAGYDMAQFVVDYPAKTVTCPQGKTNALWSPSTNRAGVQSITVRFHPTDCARCPAKALCTTAQTGARGLRLQPTQEKHQTLQQARTDQLTPEFDQRYQVRAGIEGTLSQAVRSFTLRRTHFVGEAKTKLQHLAIASAINCSRLVAWFQHRPRSRTRVSPFAELALPLTV
jgi:transposase